MSLNKEVVVFDVDGVIFDSTNECLIIAWNAYEEMNGKNNKIYSPHQADKEYEEKFRSVRNYVRSMDEYLVVFHGCYSDKPNQNYFEYELSLIDQDLKVEYSRIFYNERKIFKKKFYQEWIELHSAYEGILEILKSCSLKKTLYFITGKDDGSVRDLMNHFAPEVKVQQIYDKYSVDNKLLALMKIANHENLSPQEIKFIDDNITHLIDPQENNFNIGLASWGYAMPDHVLMAKDRKIPILDLKNLKEFLTL